MVGSRGAVCTCRGVGWRLGGRGRGRELGGPGRGVGGGLVEVWELVFFFFRHSFKSVWAIGEDWFVHVVGSGGLAYVLCCLLDGAWVK